MNVSFRQLRLFLALAEQGSVTGAARAMHVTQPTASMQLREISETIGLPLYEVIGRKVQLTEAGKELAATARAMSELWESFEQGVDATKGLSRGKLRMAVVSTAKYFMPRLLGSFCERYPQIDASIEILNRDGVVQRLRDNVDDLYIMSMPPNDMLLGDQVLMSNPIVMIARASDPLDSPRQLALHELASQRFVLREKGSGTRIVADRHFRQQRFRPDVRLELGSNEALKEAVAGGLGIGVISVHALHGLQREHGVRVIDVAGFPLASAWHIVHPAGKKLSPAASAFRDHLMKEVHRGKWSRYAP